MPKFPSDELLVHVTGFFEACLKNLTRPTFNGLALGKWKFLHKFWKEYLIGNHSLLLITEETIVVSTLTVIASNLTGKFSPMSPILEETFTLLDPFVITYEPPIEELFTVL